MIVFSGRFFFNSLIAIKTIKCVCLFHLSSGVERISQPIIVLHIMTQNGEYKTFEVPIAMFHRLRYSIAYLLREFQMIESRQKSRR